MKHLTQIQSEFLKAATKWDELSSETQKEYLKQHPKSKRKLTAKPEATSTKKVEEKLDKKKIEMIGKKIRSYAVKSYAKLMSRNEAEENTSEESMFVNKIGDNYYFTINTNMGAGQPDMTSIFKYDSKKKKIKELGETGDSFEDLKNMTEKEMIDSII